MKQVYMVDTMIINTKGRQEKFREECDDMVAVSRFMLSFKPKRGYDVVEFKITKGMVMGI